MLFSRLFLLTIIVLIQLGCTNNKKKLDRNNRDILTIENNDSLLKYVDSQPTIIKLTSAPDVYASKALKLNEIIQDSLSEFIELETTDESLFGEINKIVIDSNYIFILDWKVTNNVYVFRRNGSFIGKLVKKGDGPGEMDFPEDFSVLGDHIYILDRQSRVFTFDINGNLLSEFKLPFWAGSLYASDTSNLLFYNKDFEYKPEYLFKVSLNDRTLSGSAFYNGYPFLNFSFDQFPFSKASGNSVLFSKEYCDTVFRYSENKLAPAYFFDFGGLEIPSSLYNNEQRFIEKSKSYRHRLNFGCYETDSTFAFSFSEKKIFFGFYNRYLEKSRVFWSIEDNLFLGSIISFPLTQVDNKLVYVIHKSNLVKRVKELKEEYPETYINAMRNGPNISKKALKIADKSKEDQNPILLLSIIRSGFYEKS